GRNHALRLVRAAADTERAAGRVELAREALVVDPREVLDIRRRPPKQRAELTGADDLEAHVRREAGGLEDSREPEQRDQLAHEECLEGLLGFPARCEDALLGAD